MISSKIAKCRDFRVVGTISRLAAVARFSRRCSLPALVVAASLALTACGEDSNNPELLPKKQAEPLLADIEAVESAAADGDCAAVDENIESIQTRIGDLGGPISQELKDNLREGAELLEEVSVECGSEPETEEPDVTDTTDETVAPAPETEPEDTTADEETDTTAEEGTTPAEEEPPAEEPDPQPEPEVPAPGPPETTPPTDPGAGSGGIGPGNSAPRGEG